MNQAEHTGSITGATSVFGLKALVMLLAFRQFFALFDTFSIDNDTYDHGCDDVNQSGGTCRTSWTTMGWPMWKPVVWETMLHIRVLSAAQHCTTA